MTITTKAVSGIPADMSGTVLRPPVQVRLTREPARPGRMVERDPSVPIRRSAKTSGSNVVVRFSLEPHGPRGADTPSSLLPHKMTIAAIVTGKQGQSHIIGISLRDRRIAESRIMRALTRATGAIEPLSPDDRGRAAITGQKKTERAIPTRPTSRNYPDKEAV